MHILHTYIHMYLYRLPILGTYLHMYLGRLHILHTCVGRISAMAGKNA
jgi:hypothetical protein